LASIHKQEREQFKKLFKQEEIDGFEDRYKVLEVFLTTEHHVTPMELTRLLAGQGHYLEPEFVHETLRLMCRFGFARRNRFDDGHFRYEHLHLGQHHDHMICTKCKKIIEFEDQTLEKLQAKIAHTHGFHMLQHRMISMPGRLRWPWISTALSWDAVWRVKYWLSLPPETAWKKMADRPNMP